MKWYYTPYGFTEMEYKGITITNSNGDYYPKGITIEICGDVIYCDNLDQAKEKIDRYVKENQ